VGGAGGMTDAEAIQAAVLVVFHMALDEMRNDWLYRTQVPIKPGRSVKQQGRGRPAVRATTFSHNQDPEPTLAVHCGMVLVPVPAPIKVLV